MQSRSLSYKTLRSFLSFSALALVCVGGSPVFAQDKPKPEPVVKAIEDATAHSIKRVYAKGDVNSYKFNVNANVNVPQAGGQSDVKLTMLVKESVKDLKEDVATVTNEFPEALANLAGMEVDISTFMPVITSTRTKDGSKEVKLDGGAEEAYSTLLPLLSALEQMQSEFYPKKEVKVGDTWKIEKETKDGDKVSKTDITITFAAVETIDDVKTFKLTVKGDKTQDKDKLTLDYSLNYDDNTGKLLKGKMKASGTAMGSPTKIDATVTLQPEDKKVVKADKQPSK